MKTEIYHCDACGKKITGTRYSVSFCANSGQKAQYSLDACADCTKPFIAAVGKAMSDSYQGRMGRDPNSAGSRARSSEVISQIEG